MIMRVGSAKVVAEIFHYLPGERWVFTVTSEALDAILARGRTFAPFTTATSGSSRNAATRAPCRRCAVVATQYDFLTVDRVAREMGIHRQD